ncbi:MAG: NUDIX domain-containing protein [Candidatus Wildermuthbacteria bacterium]|nr:NUDIX domain-containing protein [Candidatus Wildermuthbacteria bacterium]
MEHVEIIIASGPVIVEDGKALLDKHGDDNFWKFLGGKIESFDFKDADNSLEEACKQRVKKEMGFDVEIIKTLKPMLIQKPGDPNAWVVLIHYLAKRLGEIKPGPEIREWKWFDVNNLPSDCAPNIKPVIEEYLKG